MKRKKPTSHSGFGMIIAFCIVLIGLFLLPRPFFLFMFNNALIIIIVLVGIAIAFAAFLLYSLQKENEERLKALDLIDSDEMSGKQFERYIGELLASQGFSITYTPASHDFGVDIVAEKGKNKYALQVKRYAHTVGRSAVSDAIAGMRYYGCNSTMIVTNNYFSSDATRLAHSSNCTLVDRDELATWIIAFQRNQRITSLS